MCEARGDKLDSAATHCATLATAHYISSERSIHSNTREHSNRQRIMSLSLQAADVSLEYIRVSLPLLPNATPCTDEVQERPPDCIPVAIHWNIESMF